ncbi:efflux transporter outer membrane subunit [Bradyrhizobium genosp. L]|uniref:efflux transporter outer membrane subunit n=1 Tax=Bradyrhizobium genosp. L TaxID=83637 RepID=UPI0018A27EAF|nr:efflux transporter outer membrane subunit [Bradyrhizobium genosp. L]QPF81999.1 efflux transporter outer membrane subunit [Bradyrhizobium genosp. L]
MARPIHRLAVCLLASAALLAGCSVGPDFVQPDSHLPDHTTFSGQAFSDAHLPAPTDPTWWKVFADPVLTGLESRVAEANLDVRTATIRIAESRYQRSATASAQFPSINGDAKYNRELYSQNGIASLLSPLLPPGSGGLSLAPINEYNVGLDMSWEIDLWGHVRRQIESADASVDQAEDRRRDALVSVLAELASDYIQLRGVQEQIRIAENNLKVDREVLQLAQQLQQKGVRSGLDAENAAAQVEGIRAQLPSLEQQQIQYMNAIALLLDLPPTALNAELAPRRVIPRSPPRIPLGIPSELARRRPDIRAAEDQLHAATANIGVAVANFYPKFQLNGTVGLDALDFNNLFKSSSLQYNAGPSVSLPIFDGARLKSVLKLSDAQQAEAAITYHKTVLQAWHEVVNALAAHRLEQTRRVRLRAQLDHTRAALDLARSRYNDGVTDFLSVLDAERSLLQNEQQYATSTTNVSLNLVTLFKSLGGGWEQVFPDPPRPAATQASN